MVDINLFDDEAEEPKKDGNQEESWNALPDESEGQEESDLDDDLLFGDDSSEPPALDEGALLEEEAVPDFEEMDEPVSDEDYDVGDEKKKTSPLAWIFLGICCIGVVFWFVIKPMFFKPTKSPGHTTSQRPQTVIKRSTTSGKPTDVKPTGVKPTDAVVDTKQVKTKSDIQGLPSAARSKSLVRFIDATKSVFQDLASQEQLGTIMIDETRFMIMYRSSTSGLSQTIGQRIQNLIGVSNFKVSPEDRMYSKGQNYYSAVISGNLPDNMKGQTQPSSDKFASDEKFVQVIRGMIQKAGLIQKTLQQTATPPTQGRRQIKFRLTIQGPKANTLNFLESIKSMKGSWGITKILIAPVENFDTSGKEVKTDVTCWADIT